MKSNKNRIKKPTTPQEQIDIFRSRNLHIENEEEAIEILSRINYYRFSAYTLTLKQNDCFMGGTTFEDVYRLYEFDRKLRSLLVANLEVVEVSFRAQIALFHANKYGAIGYLDAENFINLSYHEEMVKQLNREIHHICAHYGRVYNRLLPIHLKIDEDDRLKGVKGNSVFAAIFIMGKLIVDKREWDSFVTSLSVLIEEYEVVDLEKPGFPLNWEELLRYCDRGN